MLQGAWSFYGTRDTGKEVRCHPSSWMELLITVPSLDYVLLDHMIKTLGSCFDICQMTEFDEKLF